MTPQDRLAWFQINPANTPDLYRLTTLDANNVEDGLLLTAADLEQLRATIDAVLPRHEHNTEASDPDGHVLFDSVCCGAVLYRCTAVENDLPCKPIILKGEDNCRECGAVLMPF